MAEYFTETHEWIKVDGDIATIGITEYAQNELGDLVYLELGEVGDTISKGDTFGVIESVKAASDIYSPISGEITEINDKVVDDPSIVNSDAFGEGWMIKVKVSDEGEFDELLSKDEYNQLIEV
jgi:glycine cleavage system H protein